MKTGFQEMIESQREMLAQWQEFNQQMFQSFWNVKPSTPPAKNKKKGQETKSSDAAAVNALAGTGEQWLEMMEKMTRQGWQTYMEMTGLQKKNGKRLEANKMWEDLIRFWTDWAEKGLAQPKMDNPTQWWRENYMPWMNQWVKMWETAVGFSSLDDKHPASVNALRQSVFGLLQSYPADQWCHLLSTYNQQLEDYINVVEDIDLPFDEMAASWEKMLATFTPRENLPFSVLGESANKYVEAFIYPLYGVVEPPQIMAHFKYWYAVQYYLMSFLIRNIELRGKVLEASLSAWPEALQACGKHFEQNGAAPSIFDFYEEFFNQLEEDLYRLMKSKDYIQVQEKIVETMVTLKSNLNKWFELGSSTLPLVTQSDMDDIAQELEALRVKIRKMSSGEEPPAPAEELKKGVTSMN
jgi:hypothetical protein